MVFATIFVVIDNKLDHNPPTRYREEREDWDSSLLSESLLLSLRGYCRRTGSGGEGAVGKCYL